jgi:hypothetical protein
MKTFLLMVLLSFSFQSFASAGDETCQSYYEVMKGGYRTPRFSLQIEQDGAGIVTNGIERIRRLLPGEVVEETVQRESSHTSPHLALVKAFTDNRGRVVAVQHLSWTSDGKLNGLEMRLKYDANGICHPSQILPIYGFDGKKPLYPESSTSTRPEPKDYGWVAIPDESARESSR